MADMEGAIEAIESTATYGCDEEEDNFVGKEDDLYETDLLYKKASSCSAFLLSEAPFTSLDGAQGRPHQQRTVCITHYSQLNVCDLGMSGA